MSEQNENILSSVKSRLDLENVVFSEYEDWLKQTVFDTADELKMLMETTEIPSDYHFIISGVVIKRFNRKRNEGQQSYSEGETKIVYEKNDFTQYNPIIRKYLRENELANKNVVSFL